MKERPEATARFVEEMVAVREQVVRMLMWEIGKSRSESENEFDRTVDYINATIASAFFFSSTSSENFAISRKRAT